jgi:hypothetical protein
VVDQALLMREMVVVLADSYLDQQLYAVEQLIL